VDINEQCLNGDRKDVHQNNLKKMNEIILNFSGIGVNESTFRNFPEAFEAKGGRFWTFLEEIGVKEDRFRNFQEEIGVKGDRFGNLTEGMGVNETIFGIFPR